MSMNLIAASDPPSWLVPAIIGGFLIIFPLFWCGILVLLSHAGGWSRLAEHYRATDREPHGQRLSCVYGRLGWVGYNGMLKVHITSGGFYLETLWLGRPGHPRLFIPWMAVSSHAPKKALFGRWTALTIGSPRLATITLPSRLLTDTPLAADGPPAKK